MSFEKKYPRANYSNYQHKLMSEHYKARRYKICEYVSKGYHILEEQSEEFNLFIKQYPKDDNHKLMWAHWKSNRKDLTEAVSEGYLNRQMRRQKEKKHKPGRMTKQDCISYIYDSEMRNKTTKARKDFGILTQ